MYPNMARSAYYPDITRQVFPAFCNLDHVVTLKRFICSQLVFTSHAKLTKIDFQRFRRVLVFVSLICVFLFGYPLEEGIAQRANVFAFMWSEWALKIIRCDLDVAAFARKEIIHFGNLVNTKSPKRGCRQVHETYLLVLSKPAILFGLGNVQNMTDNIQNQASSFGRHPIVGFYISLS